MSLYSHLLLYIKQFLISSVNVCVPKIVASFLKSVVTSLFNMAHNPDLDEASREELKITSKAVAALVSDLFNPEDAYYEVFTAPPSRTRIEGQTFILPNGHRFCIKVVPEDYQPPDL